MLSSVTMPNLVELLVTCHDEILQRWTRRVLEDPAVPDANRLSKPALEDHIPRLLEKLSTRLASNRSAPQGELAGRQLASSGVGVAHAQQRIALHYTLPEALRELSLFRLTMLAICEERGVSLGNEERELLHATIDEMMTASATERERIARSLYERAMAVVAHDLRNPLNTITMQAALLQHGTPGQEKAADTLTRNARLMDRLISDLFTFSTLQAGQFAIVWADVDVRELVLQVCEQFRSIATRRGIDVAADTPDREVRLRCDRDRIVQVLGNLVANAVKFTPDGGRVRVELDARGPQCVFRVSDTGPGIRPEQLEDVFRPFWQADVSSQGAGLGLAIARGIVEAHGGEIGVGRAGPGATFVFSIPYDAAPDGKPSLGKAS